MELRDCRPGDIVQVKNRSNISPLCGDVYAIIFDPNGWSKFTNKKVQEGVGLVHLCMLGYHPYQPTSFGCFFVEKPENLMLMVRDDIHLGHFLATLESLSRVYGVCSPYLERVIADIYALKEGDAKSQIVLDYKIGVPDPIGDFLNLDRIIEEDSDDDLYSILSFDQNACPDCPFPERYCDVWCLRHQAIFLKDDIAQTPFLSKLTTNQ